jgi:hypothetical protein
MGEGWMDVDVEDEWRKGQTGMEVMLHWRVGLRGLRPGVPKRLQGIRRAVAEAVVTHVGRQGGELQVEFSIALDEKGFEGKTSIETADLWEVARDALLAELARVAGVSVEVLREAFEAGAGSLRRILERRR